MFFINVRVMLGKFICVDLEDIFGGLLSEKVVCRNIDFMWFCMFKNKFLLTEICKFVNVGSS